MEKTGFDPKRRRLCPDGACIGVIGSDGKCRVCGRSDTGAAVKAVTDADAAGLMDGAGVADPVIEDEHEDEDGNGDGAVGEPEHEPGAGMAASGDFDAKRKLCEDGSCLGVVGADGVCPVCGTRAG